MNNTHLHVQRNLGINERLKRNVLEICLDKEQFNDAVEESAIVKLFSKLNIKKGNIEGVQLVPQRNPKKNLCGSKQASICLSFVTAKHSDLVQG